jgi:hypothetical protein
MFFVSTTTVGGRRHCDYGSISVQPWIPGDHNPRSRVYSIPVVNPSRQSSPEIKNVRIFYLHVSWVFIFRVYFSILMETLHYLNIIIWTRMFVFSESYCTVRTVETGYNDLGLCDTSAIGLNITQYQLIPHKACVFLPCLVRHTQWHVPRI